MELVKNCSKRIDALRDAALGGLSDVQLEHQKEVVTYLLEVGDFLSHSTWHRNLFSHIVDGEPSATEKHRGVGQEDAKAALRPAVCALGQVRWAAGLFSKWQLKSTWTCRLLPDDERMKLDQVEKTLVKKQQPKSTSAQQQESQRESKSPVLQPTTRPLPPTPKTPLPPKASRPSQVSPANTLPSLHGAQCLMETAIHVCLMLGASV